ncbi:MAG: transporter substrate-binding domain-containing protein [Oscillospiraceae bacterium]|jgi:polar amino acid transport system substrate-binding protein|nr:transporter substrate-binding domain-containing protein [Oscillospiraceae bacterium]
MKKYSKILALVLAICLLLALSACGAKKSGGDLSTTTAGKLTMATNAFFEPYEFYDGDKIVGIDAEIAAAIADKLGLELVIEDMEFDSIIVAINNGSVDMGMAGMTVTPERLLEVNFSSTYATGVQVIIVPEDSAITGPDDLTGKKIGVQLGTTGDIYTSGDYGDENVERYPKGSEAVMALLNGSVDCVVIDNEPAKSFVAANDGLKILDTEYLAEDYAIAISKTNEPLLEAINTALNELIADGSVQAIIDKYIKAE